MRPDTATRPVVDTAARLDTAGPRPELRAPLSPKRAFLYSLLLPGYSQSVLGRHRAGALQLAFEAASIVMIRQSVADVREARRMQADSITVSFVDAASRSASSRVSGSGPAAAPPGARSRAPIDSDSGIRAVRLIAVCRGPARLPAPQGGASLRGGARKRQRRHGSIALP